MSVLFLPRAIGIYALSVGECAFHICDFILGMIFLWKRKGYDARLFRPAAITMALAFPTALAIKALLLLLERSNAGIFLKAALPSFAGVAVYCLLLLIFKPIPHIKTLLLRKGTTKRLRPKEKAPRRERARGVLSSESE